MGNLGGHVVPGCFFLVYGFFWILFSIWLHLTKKFNRYWDSPEKYSKRELGKKSYIPQPFCYRFPLEPTCKILLSSLGIFVEAFLFTHRDENGVEHVSVGVYAPYDDCGHLRDQAKLHHLTMYACFLFSGVVDLLCLWIDYPKHTSKLVLVFALLAEGILFHFHTEGHLHLNTDVHVLLTYVIYANVVFGLLRMHSSLNILINTGFGFSLALQGSWFIQISVSLYGKHPVDEGNDEIHSAMFMVACFVWHFMFLTIFVLLLYSILLLTMRCATRSQAGLEARLKSSKSPEEDILLKGVACD